MKNIIYLALIIALVAVIILGQIEKRAADPESEPETTNEEVLDETATTSEEITATSTQSELIVVTSPTEGATVGNPLVVSGQARGYWFFEASAPVVVTNWDGLIIGEGYITAEESWMTEDFVPFSGTIEYDLPVDSYSATGTIIFERANPSGLPENAAAYEVRVQLQQ